MVQVFVVFGMAAMSISSIYANLVILATACVFYWSPGVCLGHLGGLVAF